MPPQIPRAVVGAFGRRQLGNPTFAGMINTRHNQRRDLPFLHQRRHRLSDFPVMALTMRSFRFKEILTIMQDEEMGFGRLAPWTPGPLDHVRCPHSDPPGAVDPFRRYVVPSHELS